MKFVISREALLRPLNLAAGVVERRQTLPILANVLLVLNGQRLSITGTDLEVELVGHVDLEQAPDSQGEITVPARKLVDICKSLPDGSKLEFALDDQRLVIRSGRSRFTLSTLPAVDFPNVENSPGSIELQLKQADLKRLIERTSFAMAQQDVRYYLNGMLWEVRSGYLRAVATDGHRLAMCTLQSEINVDDGLQVILPRKGVIELSRLLMDEDGTVAVVIGTNHFRANTGLFQFTSKLVDGKFPDYERVLPRAATKVIYGNREELRQAFSRTSILSNEKYRGIRMNLSAGTLRILANNPEQEEAEEEVPVDYQGEGLEIGFNVSYLLDVLGVLNDRTVKMSLADANSSVLLEETEGGDSVYVVMPMRL
jgi:DNA polymerase-3 subunit beta